MGRKVTARVTRTGRGNPNLLAGDDDLLDALAVAQALADAALAEIDFEFGCPYCSYGWKDAGAYVIDHGPECPWEAYRLWRESHGD